MRSKFLLTLFLVVTATAFVGCDARRAQMAPAEGNLLGAIKYEDENYGPTHPATVAIETDELYTRKNYSGKKVTLLWGLITLKDY